MNTKGFTLLELSIVIVIIGLIVAGVSAGQSLVKQANLRSVMTDVNQYKVAINSFKLQYDALPGDFTRAFDYWGSQNSCTDNDVTSVATGCNGNGDKVIYYNQEGFRAWQHLGLAELVDKNYLGTPGAGTSDVGNNVPASSYNNAGFSLSSNFTPFGDTAYLIVQLAAEHSNPIAAYDDRSVIAPQDAYSLDLKYDDGLPNRGKIMTARGENYFSTAGRCVDQNENVTGISTINYILTDTLISCRMYFILE